MMSRARYVSGTTVGEPLKEYRVFTPIFNYVYLLA